ncbi:MAG TPA: hypothetical protein VK436_02965 [Methanocella sp.]|nr:hypothetical protein [Methanocella sp.]
MIGSVGVISGETWFEFAISDPAGVWVESEAAAGSESEAESIMAVRVPVPEKRVEVVEAPPRKAFKGSLFTGGRG